MENIQAVELLRVLRERGFSDEQIAVEMGGYLPGNAHPSSLSVRRWRTGSSAPGRSYSAALTQLYQSTVGEEE
jgi:hypothetical protein